MFKDINLKTEIVGADLEQKINGKISYIPHVNNPKEIRFEAPTNG